MSGAEKFTARRGEPGQYRRMETSVWDLLRGLDGDAVSLFLYHWIGPHSTPYGILHIPDAYVLHDQAWTASQLKKAQAALEAADLVWRDGDLRVLVPFLMSNPPANENVVKAWTKAVARLPDSALFAKLQDHASARLTPEALAWLRPKCPGRSEPLANSSATVPEQSRNPVLSTQDSGSSTQDSGSRRQEAGVRVQGGQEGEGQGTEPDGPRSARPAAVAPRPAAILGGPADGNGREPTRPSVPAAPKSRRDSLRALLDVPADKVAGAMEQARQLKATDKEIAAAIEEVFAARRGERAVSEGTT